MSTATLALACATPSQASDVVDHEHIVTSPLAGLFQSLVRSPFGDVLPHDGRTGDRRRRDSPGRRPGHRRVMGGQGGGFLAAA